MIVGTRDGNQAAMKTEMRHKQARAQHRMMRLATYASVGVASVLVLAKLVAWIITDSVAILSSLIDSVLDAGASVINMYAVRQALTPADREHRFGHGKAEALAGLAQAAFISGSALFLLLEAGERLYSPRPISQDLFGISVMALSIVLTLILVLFQAYVVKRTGSVAISADSLHYRGDLLANLGVIAAIILSTQLGWFAADPVLAILIAGVILWGAWKIIRQALDQLMDRELPDQQRLEIRDIVLAHKEVLDMHDLRTRSSGSQTFIQLHLELAADLTLIRAHEISDVVEASLIDRFANAEVIIHQDPEGVEEPRSKFI